MNKIILKHSMTDARDCTLDWEADFEKMEMVLYVTLISPGLILDFLSSLPSRDQRFARIGIANALQISNRFNIKLFVAHSGSKVCYRPRLFLLQAISEKNDRLEIELLPC
jgi:hypothetical protein